MARFPQPFFREGRNRWCVQLNGKQINLGPDKAEAFRKYHALMAEYERQPKPKQLTADAGEVLGVLELFLQWCERHREPRTFGWYEMYLRSFAASLPARLRLTDLRPYHVETWLSKHPGWKTGRRGAVTAVQRAVNWAVKQGYAAKNPIRSVERPPAGRRKTVISQEEFDALVATERDAPFVDLLLAAWDTGARPHEILTVEARHFDEPGRRWLFPPEEAKGKKRWRSVYLTDRALEITKRLALASPVGPLFRNTDGDPWTPNSVNSRFEKRKKRLGKRWSLYAIRHSFCNRALKGGVDAITTAHLMGHADTAMVAKVYSHLEQDDSHLQAAARKLAGV